MSLHEVEIAMAWLYGALTGDATLTSLLASGAQGIWRAYAPPGTAPVYVIYGLQSGGNDTLTMNAVRLLTNPLYQVKAVGPAGSSMQSILDAASEIDNLLKRTSGTVAGGFVGVCYREQPLSVDELVNGEVWSNVGGMYRLQIQQTT